MTQQVDRHVASRARVATTVAFVAHGFGVGSWASRVADVQEALGLSERTLGFALLGAAVGGVIVLPLAGGLSARLGARWLTVLGWVPLGSGLALAGQAGSALRLGVVLVLFGLGLSIVDVGMNAQGAAVERALGRSVMIGFHAWWSIGGVFAAVAGSAAIRGGLSAAWHLGLAAALLASVTVVAAARMIPHVADVDARPPVLALPGRPLLGLALVGAAAALGEGAATDWAGVHLREVLDSAPSVAAWGYLVFAAGMTLARLVGDRAADRRDVRGLVRQRAGIAAAGFVVVAVAPVVAVGLLGFLVAGLGVAVLIPLAFSVSERVPGVASGQGVAGVATISYTAFVAGPPVIGMIAEATSLRWSMALVALICGLVAARPPVPEPR